MRVDDITARAHDNSNDGSTRGGGGESDRLGPDIWKIIAVTVAGAFMAQLSTTMVNVSLSSLGTELHASLSAIQWVTSGYLLALALMLPLTGWLVDRIGAKALYLRCFVAFTLSSTLCGVAWSANSLIAFRVLQGMSGGLLAPMRVTPERGIPLLRGLVDFRCNPEPPLSEPRPAGVFSVLFAWSRINAWPGS